MDPNAALKELRRLAEKCLNSGYDEQLPVGWINDALQALEHADSLDNWLTSGGALPADWCPRP